MKEQPVSICCGLAGHGFGINAVDFGKAGVGHGNPGWFVAFAAVGLRGEVGGVGFNEQAIEWDLSSGAAEFVIFFVGQHAAEGNMKSEFHAGFGCFGGTAEGVHDPAEWSIGRTLIQHFDDLPFGFAAVDNEWLPAAAGQLNVAEEVVFLGIERSIFPVEIESSFADADDLWMAGELFDLLPVPRLYLVSVVGVDADDGGQAVVAIGEEHDGAAGCCVDADGEHPYDSGRAGSEHDFIEVSAEGVGFEVTVGVDQSE